MKPKPVRTFTATPSLPPSLERLRDLAYNVRWAWDEDTLDLFRRLGGDLWTTSGHNPVLLLGAISQDTLADAAADEGFQAHFARVIADFDSYMERTGTWYHQKHEPGNGPLVAYFSAEFGITECLSIFAGGLGALAGDHLKSASDLGIPIIGVGLLYQQGYFRQHLNEAGWQQETYQENDFANLPLTLERDAAGEQVTISVQFPERPIHARIWRLNVGRVPLFLLDTNFAANARDEDRDLTDFLYGGGNELRIRQELMLGIGGYRALKALGLSPKVYHVNEGHSAFLALERVRRLMQRRGLSFDEAKVAASASIVFTTHTPVEAGHDRFPPELMDQYLVPYARKELGLSRNDFLALGRENADNDQEFFGMTKLALRMSAANNGVARLHGAISRKMWQRLWPDLPEEEVPIGHITNGIHVSSWLSADMKLLFDRFLGRRWRDEPGDKEAWSRVDQIPGARLWRTHVRRRERLIAMARRRLRRQLTRIGAPQADIAAASEVLDPEVLTIGFARRFATYKRATLLLSDPDRLASILGDEERPVQVIFAGKAHPRDNPGKTLIQLIFTLSRQERFRRRIVFLEDYDMAITRAMVQGADIWLNTPRRPREASGTSGMKAAANGCLNLSILDGWWDEAYQPELGWAIGAGEIYDDEAYQDSAEAANLYDLLTYDIVPLFYKRSADGLPLDWIARMKGSIATYTAFFNTHRMVQEYTEKAYQAAAARYQHLMTGDMARTKALAAWTRHVQQHWPQIHVVRGETDTVRDYSVGEAFTVQARVRLGALTPNDVSVQLYLGRINGSDEIVDATTTPMEPSGPDANGAYVYEASAVTCLRSGFHGYTFRVLPRHEDLPSPFLPGLVVWASENP